MAKRLAFVASANKPVQSPTLSLITAGLSTPSKMQSRATRRRSITMASGVGGINRSAARRRWWTWSPDGKKHHYGLCEGEGKHWNVCDRKSASPGGVPVDIGFKVTPDGSKWATSVSTPTRVGVYM